MQQEAEYVDPNKLLPYREYQWSRWHNRYGQKGWDELRDDIAQDGFREPAVLHYNHVTGQGYVGEGNHRIGVAIELGVPVPLVVARSTKFSPEFPMKQITDPGEFSMRDERGFSRFPPVASPSQIGLPILDEGKQQVMWQRIPRARGRDDGLGF